jgi:hypothetical protein
MMETESSRRHRRQPLQELAQLTFEFRRQLSWGARVLVAADLPATTSNAAATSADPAIFPGKGGGQAQPQDGAGVPWNRQ